MEFYETHQIHRDEADLAPEKAIHVGARVWWDDPDQGVSSGHYQVISINGEVVTIQNAVGSVSEVLEHELS